MIVHIVIFKFKDENKDANILKTKELLNALESKIEELVSMEVGVNFDTAERAYDLSLYSKFQTKADLDTYATHSEHLKVVSFIKTVVESSKVVDYILE
jgi:hypothetical protein